MTFVRFTSNFVHFHPLPPLQERVMSLFSLLNFFLPKCGNFFMLSEGEKKEKEEEQGRKRRESEVH
jgi:hypothetical protein